MSENKNLARKYEENKILAVGYSRVSTESENQASSFRNQNDYFKNAINNTEGYTFYKLYSDKGLSGVYWKKRDGFNQMLKDAGIDVVIKWEPRTKKNETSYFVSNRQPKFNEIWIKNTARFARNTFSFEIIEKLREKEVYVRFITQNLYTKDRKQDFMLKMLMNMDENESRLKSEAVRWGYQQGKKHGMVYTHPRITGYDYNKEKNTLTKNKDAETVKLIFDLYTEEGMGVRRIINELEKRGIKSPNGNPRWGNTTIKNILHQEKYTGMNNPLRLDHGEFGKKTWAHIKQEYDLLETDKIEPIITMEQFQKVQDIIANKVVVLNNQTKGRKMSYSPYSKKLVCEQCGANYLRNSDWKDSAKTKKYYYYNCSCKKKLGTVYCDNPNVMEDTLDSIIKEYGYGKINSEIELRQYSYQYLLLKVIELELEELEEDQDIKYKKERIETLHINIEELKEKSQKYFIQLVENPGIDKYGVFQKMIDDVNEEIEQKQTEYDELVSHDEEKMEDIKNMWEEFKTIRDMKQSFKQRYSKEEILDMVDTIYVDKQVDNPRKSELMFTYMIYHNSRMILQKYEDKYKFTTENFERDKRTDLTKRDVNTLYAKLAKILEEAYI